MKKKLSFLLIFVMILSMVMTGCNKTTEIEEEIVEVIVESINQNSEQSPNDTSSIVTNNNTSSTQTPDISTQSPASSTQSPTSSTQEPTSSVQSPTSSNTTSEVQKPTGPNVPVLNCGFATHENALSWAQTYGKEMTWGQDYAVDSDLMVANIRPISLSGSYALKHDYQDGGAGIRGAHAYIDFSKNEIGFKNPNSPTTALKSKKCSFTFVARREYYVEHTVIGGHILSLTITDTVENKKDTIVYDDDRADYFSRSIGVRTDEYNDSYVEVMSKKVYSLQPYNPQVLILGDSFVAGFYETRYATLIGNKLNGSTFINGISGGATSDIKKSLKYLPQICQPKYVILGIGTNQNNFSSWKTDMENILSTIKNDLNGATPILATVTLREDNKNLAFVTQANEWIRNSGYKYVDVNKLTTVGGDTKTQDLSKFQSDKVHLTPGANQEVYNSFLSTVPELFN